MKKNWPKKCFEKKKEKKNGGAEFLKTIFWGLKILIFIISTQKSIVPIHQMLQHNVTYETLQCSVI